MSEGQEGREDQAITSPETVEEHEMDDLSPIMSYNPGDDCLERVISEGESKYEGKGKGRTESFSQLPTTVPSTPSKAPRTRPNSEVPGTSGPSTAPSTRPNSETPGTSGPSTAPSTRPNSEIPGTSGPSTAPSTRPNSEIPDAPGPSTAPSTGPVSQAQDDKAVNQAQADPEPSTADGTSSVTEKEHESAGIAAQGDPGPSTADGTSSITEKKHESAEIVAQGGPGPSTDQAESADMANQGDSGPSTDQAESASATGRSDTAAISAWDGTPNHAVQSDSESIELQEKLPTGPFYSSLDSILDPAIAPTGPPNSSTTMPTAKDKPLKKVSTEQMSIAKESGPSPVAPQTSSNPPQVDEGASGSQANQPQKLDAVEGQDPESKEEQATTEPRRVALGGTDKMPDTRRGGEDAGKLPTRPPKARLNRPHHRNEITPKPILKKTVGTAAEARRAEQDGASEGRVPKCGMECFPQEKAHHRAARHHRDVEADNANLPNTATESGAWAPRLAISGVLGASESDGENEERTRKICPLRCTLL